MTNPQGLLPRVLDPSSAAGVSALSATLTGTFVTATPQGALPQSRELAAGTGGISVTDNGAQSTIVVENTLEGANPSVTGGAIDLYLSKVTDRLNFKSLVAGTGITLTDATPTTNDVTIASTGAAITGPVTHEMHWDLDDGVTPIPDAFTNTWTLYKVGRIVTAFTGTTGYTNPSILDAFVTTSAGTEFPAAYRPFTDIVQPAIITQGAGPGVPATSGFLFELGGQVTPLWVGREPWPQAQYYWAAGSLIDWPTQVFTWLAA